MGPCQSRHHRATSARIQPRQSGGDFFLPPLPSSPLLSSPRRRKEAEKSSSALLLTFKVGIIHAVGLIASRAAAADAAQKEREKPTKQAHPSPPLPASKKNPTKPQLGSVWSQIFVALNGRKRGRKTPGTDLRSPKRKKKGKAVDPGAVSDSLN